MEGKPIEKGKIANWRDKERRMPIKNGGMATKRGHEKKETKEERTKIGDKIFLYLWVPGPREKCVMVIASNINTILLP